MTILATVRRWLTDPFGFKQKDQKHTQIQSDLQVLRGQVNQKTRDLSRYPYRTLHRDFTQTETEREANVRVHE